MKYKKLIITGCVLVFSFFLIISIYQGFLATQKGLDEHLPSTNSISPEIFSLISAKYRADLKVIEVNQNKVREPISIIALDNKYHLVTYKIKLEKDISLNSVLLSEIKDVNVSNGYSYGTIGKDIIYRLRYKAGPIRPVNEIYLTFCGDSLQRIIENDSIVSYHLIADNFSIRYSKEDAIDILITGNEKPFGTTSIIPIDILFLKRKNDLYLLLLTPIKTDDSISPDLLYKIVTEQ